MATEKLGAGHAAAMGRLGLKELRNAFNPSKESVADAELGLYGTPTPGQIDSALKGDGQDQTLSMDDLRIQAQEKSNEVELDGPDQSRGMEM